MFYRQPMTDREIRDAVIVAQKNFPPRTHHVETITVDGPAVSLTVVPKPPCSGAPKIMSFETTDDPDSVMRGMMRVGFFQKQYDLSLPVSS